MGAGIRIAFVFTVALSLGGAVGKDSPFRAEAVVVVVIVEEGVGLMHKKVRSTEKFTLPLSSV